MLIVGVVIVVIIIVVATTSDGFRCGKDSFFGESSGTFRITPAMMDCIKSCPGRDGCKKGDASSCMPCAESCMKDGFSGKEHYFDPRTHRVY
jgi:hypothetical protein